MLRKKILVIDDDRGCRMMLKLFLRNKAEILEAENGLDGLEIIKEHNDISVIFLDLNMPVLDGYGFLKEIPDHTPQISPSIYITSCTDKNEFYNNLNNHNIDSTLITGYFEKPFMMEKLPSEIHQVT